MATESPVSSALTGLGFERRGSVYFGSWRRWAVLLRQSNAKNLLAIFAVRLPKNDAVNRKLVAGSLKNNKRKGVAFLSVVKTSVAFSVRLDLSSDPAASLRDTLDYLSGVLLDAGIAPADTCAVSGADRPDSLSIMTVNNMLSYQPVRAAAVREQCEKAHSAAEDNQANGSYALGLVGALLGMLVGLLPNLACILFADRIYALLFALVPLAAMYGYKLFKGKMSKGSIVIVVALSLLAVLLIPYFELVFYLVRDYGTTLGEGFSYSFMLLSDPSMLSEIGGELLQLLLFMGLGIWISWKYMSGQTNSTQLAGSEAQLASLRPNPNFESDELY